MEEKNIENMGKGGLWDTQQAADYLSVSKSFLNIDRVNRRHGVPYVRVGSRVRYRQADLDAFLNKTRVH